MLNSFVLVKNLRSNANELVFADFKFVKIKAGKDYDLKRAQGLFPHTSPPFYKDWLYVQCYENDDQWETIPRDIEDTLLLLRLYKLGDLVFLQPCIENEEGNLSCQSQYPVMVNVHSTHNYEFQLEECPDFDKFASEIKSLKNWSAGWFKIARRFFLYGGGKEYQPDHNEVDRIVDYMTALEAVLVHEKDFVGRRLRERAVSLLDLTGIVRDETKRLLKDFYDVRSSIVHGSDISSMKPKSEIFEKNIDLEVILRQILVSAIRKFPEKEKDRKSYLKTLFDVSDKDRADLAFNHFCQIKNKIEKIRYFGQISGYIKKKSKLSS